jgi:uncharacterized protein
MTKDYSQQPLNAVRRTDRAVEDEAWIRHFLHSAAIGTLATVDEGQPFINTNLFVYDEARHCIYLHTARTGRTPTTVARAERACFSVMTLGRLLPAPQALEFSLEYGGVVVFGSVSLVEEQDEALMMLQALMDKYAPHLRAEQDYRPPVPEELKRTAVIKLCIEQWSGKKKEVGEMTVAYWFEEAPILRSVQARLGRSDSQVVLDGGPQATTASDKLPAPREG